MKLSRFSCVVKGLWLEKEREFGPDSPSIVSRGSAISRGWTDCRNLTSSVCPIELSFLCFLGRECYRSVR